MNKSQFPPVKRSNRGFWIFVVIILIGMLLVLSATYVVTKVGDIQATMHAVEFGTPIR